MMVSPDRSCPKCGGIFWELIENSCDQICIDCRHREVHIALEDIHPGITRKIIEAQAAEAAGEEGEE